MPTYKEFRTFAVEQGLSIADVARPTQAGDPYKTAERILIHLAGTHLDDALLPYPKLCALYKGTVASPEPEKPLPHPVPFRRVPKLPTADLEAVSLHNHIRTLDLPIDQLTHLLFWYSQEVLAKIVESRAEVFTTPNTCPCGCRQSLQGRQRFASDACRRRLRRRSVRRSRRS